MAETLAAAAGVVATGGNTFESLYLPQKIGNTAEIGFGGGTIGVAINAAIATTSHRYHLYSVMGYFVGPATTKEKLTCTVRIVRDTKSFATRQVEVSQVQGKYGCRLVLTLMADFQVAEATSLLTYSSRPDLECLTPEQCPTTEELKKQLLESGRMQQKHIDILDSQFGFIAQFIDHRECPSGIHA